MRDNIILVIVSIGYAVNLIAMLYFLCLAFLVTYSVGYWLFALGFNLLSEGFRVIRDEILN